MLVREMTTVATTFAWWNGAIRRDWTKSA